MRLATAALVVVACGGSPRATTQTAPPGHAAPPAEIFQDGLGLLIHGPAADTPRTIIDRFGQARLGVDDEPLVGGAYDGRGDILAVAEARDDRVRVRSDTGGLRMLVWIDRADLAPAIVREVGVAHRVRLLPGAPITQIAGTGEHRRIRIETDDLVIAGDVGADDVGKLWRPVTTTITPESTYHLDPESLILDAPSTQATVVARTTDYLSVVVLDRPTPEWIEIERIGTYTMIRGFVAAAMLTDKVLGSMQYGHDHVATFGGDITVEFTIGTCIYAGVDGAIIGIASVEQTRPGARLDDGWFEFQLYTLWGPTSVFVHDEGTTEAPRLTGCADPAALVVSDDE